MSDPADEFEAVWAVVRRLEAQIRRLDASITELQASLAALETGSGRAPGPGPLESDRPVTEERDQQPEVPVSPPPFDDVVDEPGSSNSVYRVVFDGGSIGNPGHGYGSFHIASPRGRTLQERLNFADRGNAVTNNQAEYLSLIHALQRLEAALGERAQSATVEIRGDSQLVINQLNGRWKVRNEDLRTLFEQARSLLDQFGRVELRWHDRANSVALLGH